jgi:hypothetical protein
MSLSHSKDLPCISSYLNLNHRSFQPFSFVLRHFQRGHTVDRYCTPKDGLTRNHAHPRQGSIDDTKVS